MSPPQPIQQRTEVETLYKLEVIKLDPGKVQFLLSGGKSEATAPQPLVCLKGTNRPSLIPSFQGSTPCDAGASKVAQVLAYDSYEKACVLPVKALDERIAKKFQKRQALDAEELTFLKNRNRSVSVDMFTLRRIHPLAEQTFTPAGNSSLKFEETTCGDAEYSIPVVLKNLGLENPTAIHPFIGIVNHLNLDQLHDFRSAASFLRIAQNLEYGLLAAGKRELTLSYPASGSHVAALIIPFELIDDGVIDSATLNFTEIDTHAPDRVRAYLKALSKLNLDSTTANPSPVISDLKESKVTANPGYENVFSFKYHRKPVTLRMAIERSAISYIDDSYLKGSDLVILHDLGEFAEEERIVTRALQYPRDANSPLWIASDHSVDALKNVGKDLSFDGRFGCGGVERSGRFYADKTWAFTPDGDLVQAARSSFLDPFSMKSNLDPLQIHLEQKMGPVHLTQISGKTGPWMPQRL